MGTGKPDLKQPGRVGNLRQPEFATVWRGYDPTQVIEYLGWVAEHVQALESKVRQLESGKGRPSDPALTDQALASEDPYENVSARVADLVRTFDQDVERLRGEAEAEAASILAEARTDADAVRLDAQSKAEEVRALAERTLNEAQKEADRVLSGLASRRDVLLDELRTMRDRMLDLVGGLEAVIQSGSTGDDMVIVGDTADTESAEKTSVGSSKARPEPDA
jgi:cell division septum initiation protein DivIVA